MRHFLLLAILFLLPSCGTFRSWSDSAAPKTKFVFHTEVKGMPVEISLGWPRKFSAGKQPIAMPKPEAVAVPDTKPSAWGGFTEWWKERIQTEPIPETPETTTPAP